MTSAFPYVLQIGLYPAHIVGHAIHSLIELLPVLRVLVHLQKGVTLMRYLLARRVLRHQLELASVVIPWEIRVVDYPLAGLPGQALSVFMDEGVVVTGRRGLVRGQLHAVLGHVGRAVLVRSGTLQMGDERGLGQGALVEHEILPRHVPVVLGHLEARHLVVSVLQSLDLAVVGVARAALLVRLAARADLPARICHHVRRAVGDLFIVEVLVVVSFLNDHVLGRWHLDSKVVLWLRVT